MPSNSPRFSLDGVDFHKVGVGLIVALAGVGVVTLQSLSGLSIHLVLGNFDFSSIATLAEAAGASSLVNLLRKFMTDHTAN